MARASNSRRPPRNRRPPLPARRSSTPWILGGLAVVVVIAAVVAFAMSGTGSGGLAEPAREPVTVRGTPIAMLTTPDPDPAIGQPIPSIAGIGLDGQPLEIGPDDGPMAIVVLAHWCPHCQTELPALAEFIADGRVPAGVSVVGVSTAIDPVRPNYPPSAWLEREGWTQPTITDDADSAALNALGIGSFPGFVFVAADGTVAARLTGAIGVDRFAQALESIAP